MKFNVHAVALVAFVIGAVSALALSQLAGESRRTAPPQPTTGSDASSTDWLTGSPDEKFAQIERHLRGLDMSMAEIGYRYDELMQAGKTRNWEYAQYQTEKIDLSLRLAIERRPRRAKSATPFLDDSIPPVLEAIEVRDAAQLDVALKNLHNGCIQCHRAENVLYMGDRFATIQPTSDAAASAISNYQELLTPEYLAAADRSAGRQVFSMHCASCHQLFGEGEAIGPDLTDLQRSDLDYLLRRILDPNALISHDYQMEVIVTLDGRSVSGLVKREDDASLVLQTATEKVVIPTDEIEQRLVSNVSMMPEDLFQELSDEQVRDVIAYLQGSQQVPPPSDETKTHSDGSRS